MSVIDDVKKLARAAQDSSAMKRNLCERAKSVLCMLIEHIGFGQDGLRNIMLELPREYHLQLVMVKAIPHDARPGEQSGFDDDAFTYVFSKGGTPLSWGVGFWPDSARIFVQDVATGWLAEVADWLWMGSEEDEQLVVSVAAAQQYWPVETDDNQDEELRRTKGFETVSGTTRQGH